MKTIKERRHSCFTLQPGSKYSVGEFGYSWLILLRRKVSGVKTKKKQKKKKKKKEKRKTKKKKTKTPKQNSTAFLEYQTIPKTKYISETLTRTKNHKFLYKNRKSIHLLLRSQKAMSNHPPTGWSLIWVSYNRRGWHASPSCPWLVVLRRFIASWSSRWRHDDDSCWRQYSLLSRLVTSQGAAGHTFHKHSDIPPATGRERQWDKQYRSVTLDWFCSNVKYPV